MNPDLLVQIIQANAAVGLAVFAIWMLRQSYSAQEKRLDENAQRWRELAEKERADKLMLIEAIREHSEVLAKLVMRLEQKSD